MRNLALRNNAKLLVVLGLIGVLLIIGFTLSDRFRTFQNLSNVYEQSAPLAFVALGQTVVILTGGIDLTFDSQIALLSSLTSGLIDGKPERVLPVVIGVLFLGTTVGLINGILILLLRVHPLIVTLGMAAILQGCALLYTMTPIGSAPAGFDFFAYGLVSGVPAGTTLAILCFGAVGVMLRFTRLGRQIFAFGGDPYAAKLVGLPVARVILFAYGLSGFLAAVTSIFLVSRLGVGSPTVDGGYNLASITPVVVGGTMLTGGRGGVLGTLLGVFMVQLLNNLLNFLDVSTFYQWMIQGLIVISAVSLYYEDRRGVPA
jgi:ribose transport system permease protein